MKRTLIIILSVTFLPECVLGDESDTGSTVECKSWGNVRDFLQKLEGLPLLQLQKMKCSVYKKCSGIGCSGKYKDSDFTSEVKFNSCDAPVHINFSLSIPSLNVSSTKSYGDGDKIQLPVISVPVEISLKQQGQTMVVGLSQADTGGLFQMLHLSNETFVLPVCKTRQSVPSSPKPTTDPTAKTVTNTTSTASPSSCETDAGCNASETCTSYNCQCLSGFFRNSSGWCVHDSSKNTSRTCNVSQLRSCREYEICVQLFNTSTIGFCICLANYSVKEDGFCAADDAVSDKPKSSVALSLAITIPVLILIACAGVVFLAVKFRLVSRCRDRRGIRSYEVVDIGNDDDEPLVT